MTITQSQIENFRNLGFLVIKDFFDAKVMNNILKEVNAMEDEEPLKGGIMKYFEESSNNSNSTPAKPLLIRIENFIEANDYLNSIVNHPTIHEILTELFDEPGVLLKEKINYKPPGSPPDHLHQDSQAGWDDYGSEFLSVLIAVENSTTENACVEFDTSGAYKDSLAGPLWEPLDADDLPNLNLQPIETNSGDIIIFNSYVPHGSESNSSNQRRCNIYLTYNKLSEGDHRIEYFKDKRKSFPPNNERDPNKDYSFKV